MGLHGVTIPGLDPITASAPFLRALVVLTTTKSTRSKGADAVIGSKDQNRSKPGPAVPRQTIVITIAYRNSVPIDLKSALADSGELPHLRGGYEGTGSRAISRDFSTFFVKCHSRNGSKREIAVVP